MDAGQDGIGGVKSGPLHVRLGCGDGQAWFSEEAQQSGGLAKADCRCNTRG